MARHTTFCFTLRPSAAQAKVLWRHAGAARFAYNQSLSFVKEALEQRRAGAEVRVPWTGYDLIQAFNDWKRSQVQADGTVGLPWRSEVVQEVFEEAAVDLGRALAAHRARHERGKPAGFPTFRKRSSSRQSFRIRNRRIRDFTSIRVGTEARPRSVRLPKIGEIPVHECTRRLRRMLAGGRARILFATVSHRTAGRWRVSLNVEAADLHPAHRHVDRGDAVGIDRGLETFAVLADARGREVERITSPRPLEAHLPRLRKRSRSLQRKVKGSRNRRKARIRLARFHDRIARIRRDFVQRTSSRLAKTHGHLVIETLSVANLVRNRRLARSLVDSAWAMFGSILAYKVAWHGGTLTMADRFYPSTRRCSACGTIGDRLPMWRRTFCCQRCGHEADRDTNAAACLAQVPGARWTYVAARQAETKNVCREGSAGAWGGPARATRLVEAERALARRPRRAVSWERTFDMPQTGGRRTSAPTVLKSFAGSL